MWKRIVIIIVILLSITLTGVYAMNKNNKEEEMKKEAIEHIKEETGKTFVPERTEWADPQAGKMMFVIGHFKETKKKIVVPVIVREDGRYRLDGWSEEGDVDPTNYELQNELEKIK